MEIKDIKEALKNNQLSASPISITELSEIMKYVEPHMYIDSETLDYFYSIPIKEIAESSMPSEMLEELNAQGWSVSKDGENIIVYITKPTSTNKH